MLTFTIPSDELARQRMLQNMQQRNQISAPPPPTPTAPENAAAPAREQQPNSTPA